MPAEYGPWGRIYDLFRRWQRDVTWQRVLPWLQWLRRQGCDRVGPERRLHSVPCPSACSRGPQAG
ncbi:hypothetical protein [Streptomyces sp. NPDC056713]|uniref:hypothetical protein n=1 Tax=unclassified Streptomyces TaxID=2593676 RepID=UPI0036B49438